MSLPNYLINLDELKEILLGVFAGGDSDLTSKIQRSKGLELRSIPYMTQNVTWTPAEDIAITAIRFGQEDIRNLGYVDYFDLYIDSEKVMSNIYQKELNEYKPFRNFYPVASGTDIEFRYRNDTGIEKEVKFDIDYIGSKLPQKEVVILCRDSATGELIGKFSVFYTPIFEGVINPPSIEGYTPVTSPISVNIRASSPSPQTITFFYDRLPPPLPDPEINHSYDWKFVMRWEGNVHTDLDFHATFSDKEVYYGNKDELILDDNGEPIEGVWLDQDYTSHSATDDREKKPEIMTILGEPASSVRFFVRNYRGGDELSKEVTVEAFRLQSDGTEKLMATVSKGGSLFHPSKADVDFMTVYPSTGEITKH